MVVKIDMTRPLVYKPRGYWVRASKPRKYPDPNWDWEQLSKLLLK